MHEQAHTSNVHWTGRLLVPTRQLRDAIAGGWLRTGIAGWRPVDVGVVDGERSLVVLAPKPNLVVNVGINRGLDLLMGINGPPAVVDSMGVDNGTVNPTSGTTRSADGNSTSRRLQALDGVATRTNQVVSAVSTFTQAGVNFVMKRLFLSAGTTANANTLYS